MARRIPEPTTTAPRRPHAPVVSMIELTRIDDERGVLVAGEGGGNLPFTPMRVFAISDVPPGARRAEHANRTCEEVLICLSGRCSVVVHDGISSTRFALDSPQRGLHVPPMHWLVCEEFSPGAVLLVLASHPYDPATRIQDWETFLSLVAEPNDA